jgi:hypothetical protein
MDSIRMLRAWEKADTADRKINAAAWETIP